MKITTLLKSRISIVHSALITAMVTLIICLSACKPNGSQSQVNTPTETKDSAALQISTDSLDAVVNSIIAISTSDFHKNQQPIPVAFREVQLKYYFKPNKELLYILCGEFSTQAENDKAEWTHFTTIINSDYEQWIGPNGLTYCEHSTAIDYTKAELATLLKQRLDELNIKQ
ncbi:MAG: hypothetical protein JNL95_10470 [Chitinophagales bacterium]|nr:hypothetical protein [Chitinophagales bacterium]